MFADAVHEQRHLVGDLSDVRLRGAEHAEAAARSGRGDEEHRVVELDHRLSYVTGSEVAARALGEALQSRRDRGEMFGVLAPQAGARRGDESVVGQHQGVPYGFHALGQVVQQPTESRVLHHRSYSRFVVPPGKEDPTIQPSPPLASEQAGWGHGKEDDRQGMAAFLPEQRQRALPHPKQRCRATETGQVRTCWRRFSPRSRAAGRCASVRRIRRAVSVLPSRSRGPGRRRGPRECPGRGLGRGRRRGRRTRGLPRSS